VRVFLARSQIIPIASISKTVPRTLSAVYFCWNVARLAKFKVHSFIFWHASTSSESDDAMTDRTLEIGHRTSDIVLSPNTGPISDPESKILTTISPSPYPPYLFHILVGLAIRPYRFIATIEPHHDRYRYRGPSGFHI
jgi:hypothetical protein